MLLIQQEDVKLISSLWWFTPYQQIP